MTLLYSLIHITVITSQHNATLVLRLGDWAGLPLRWNEMILSVLDQLCTEHNFTSLLLWDFGQQFASQVIRLQLNKAHWAGVDITSWVLVHYKDDLFMYKDSQDAMVVQPCSNFSVTQIARLMGPPWGPSGGNRAQVGPMNFAIWVV